MAPAPRGYVVAANAAAGSSERETIRQVAGRLAEAAPTSLAWTDGDDEFDAVVHGLDGRLLVLAGGDGTFHFALNRLARTGHLDVPVGIIPAGTGNDLARGIGIGADLDQAVEVLVDGRPRWYPAIETSTGELAHNNAHVGLGTAAAERGTAWKPRLGRVAYPVGAAVEGVRHRAERLTLSVDGEIVHDGPALVALVMLGPSMGGGVELTEDVDVAEPQLDLVVVEEPTGRAARLAMAVGAVRRTLLDRDDVGRWSGRSIEIAGSGSLRADVDGEISDWPSPLELTIRPRTWQIVSPAG